MFRGEFWGGGRAEIVLALSVFSMFVFNSGRREVNLFGGSIQVEWGGESSGEAFVCVDGLGITVWSTFAFFVKSQNKLCRNFDK